MGTIENVEQTEAFQTARELVKVVYKLSKGKRFSDDFALVNQIRRAAISLLSNISEVFERDGNKELMQFLSIAKGSVGEINAQLIIALDLDYITQREFEAARQVSASAMRQLGGWLGYLRRGDYAGRKFKMGS